MYKNVSGITYKNEILISKLVCIKLKLLLIMRGHSKFVVLLVMTYEFPIQLLN